MITVAAARASRDVLEAALARRRMAMNGGAYALLTDPGRVRKGPLAGVPLAVKDLIDVAGTPTRAGSWSRRDAPAARADAPAVRRLRLAGAAIVGKTALHELAFGTTGVNAFEGTPRNPRDRTRIPGGSSSGSAVAVAEGSAAIALGSDTGGSVRIPAALCGVVGLKPSYGAISVRGVLPLAPSLDHVGIFAADVEGVREALAVLAPRVTRQAVAPRAMRQGEAPGRIGVDEVGLADASTEVAAAIDAALRACGIAVGPARLPDPDRVARVSTTILFHEAAGIHARTLSERPWTIGADVRERLLRGSAIKVSEYRSALRERKRIRSQVEIQLKRYDAVAMPTVAIVAPPIASVPADPGLGPLLVRYTRLANVTGLPAISIPLPVSGLPIGLQLIGRDEATLLAVAAHIEGRLRS